MKVVASSALAMALGGLAAPFAAPEAELEARASSVLGFDISHYQSSVDFSSAYNDGGLRFVYIKATEGTTYKDPAFSSHYAGATNAGFIRGGYHYASGTGDGSQEANFFLEGDCKSVSWIRTFSNTYHSKTGQYPTLYSSPSWWSSCTGNSNAFVDTNPLVMACYNANPCTPQGGWPYYTIWQYKDSNPYGGDSDRFNGDMTQLKKLASG